MYFSKKPGTPRLFRFPHATRFDSLSRNTQNLLLLTSVTFVSHLVPIPHGLLIDTGFPADFNNVPTFKQQHFLENTLPYGGECLIVCLLVRRNIYVST